MLCWVSLPLPRGSAWLLGDTWALSSQLPGAAGYGPTSGFL